MTVGEFRIAMASGEKIVAESPLHEEFHRFADEAKRALAEINFAYRTPAEIRAVLSRLWEQELDEAVTVWTPFMTDCGKNTHIAKGVFINSNCQFQDQGGIWIGEGSATRFGLARTRRFSPV